MTPKDAASAKSPREICIQNLVPFRIRELQCAVRFVRPAQLTRISTPPISLQAAARRSSTSAASATSQGRASERTPISRISLVIFCTSSGRRPVAITFAPASANPLASVSPIPLVPILQIEKRVSHVNASPTGWSVLSERNISNPREQYKGLCLDQS